MKNLTEKLNYFKSNFCGKLKSKFVILAIFLFVASSCKKSDKPRLDRSEILSIVSNKLKAAGFDTSEGLIKVQNGYLVEYDIFMTEEDIDNLSKPSTVKIPLSVNINNKLQSKDAISHYRTNAMVSGSWSSQRNIQVYIDPQFGVYLQNALNIALQRYNNLDLSLIFSKTTNASVADIKILPTNSQPYLMSAGFPYSNGNPYNQILVNTDEFNSSYNRADAASSFAHEIGHCIGFRHNDYMNRTFSGCSSVGANEGSGINGAVYVPGTTPDPNPGSWMLACSNSFDRPFTLDDILALRSLYSYRKNIYVKSIMTLISDESYSIGCCDDRALASWNVRAEFYQDVNFTIPYTTAGYFVLNTNVGGSTVTTPILVPDGLTSFDLGVHVRDVYYSSGSEVSDNSTGYTIAPFVGYWLP